MIAPILVAAVTIAFPREGQRFGPLDKCYLIGATDGGETNIVVAGRDVPVYRTGAWGVLLDVTPGTNTVTAGGATRTFFVAPRSKSAATKEGLLFPSETIKISLGPAIVSIETLPKTCLFASATKAFPGPTILSTFSILSVP